MIGDLVSCVLIFILGAQDNEGPIDVRVGVTQDWSPVRAEEAEPFIRTGPGSLEEVFRPHQACDDPFPVDSRMGSE